VYCQNYQISQRVEEIPTRTSSPDELAAEMLVLQGKGAHNINLVSPTHVIAQVAEGLCVARERGLSIPVVYNTNGYDAVETLRCLEGLIDIYLPDIKYSDDAVARTYSGIDRYVEVSRSAIAEMFRQVGNLSLDREGIAQRGVLVRHLVLPEDLAGSMESLAFLASLSTEIVISLMAQYSPQYKARSMPPLDRKISREEYERVLDSAWDLGLERCFIQEVESSEALIPDFRRADPFETIVE
jgi:putative pyruvate formate lyase activating enzyme